MNDLKNKALIAAMQSLCIAFPTKPESWIAEQANKQVNEIMKFMESNEKHYIRFGDLPVNETSGIYKMGIKIGSECGVSVYHAVKIDNKWNVVFPSPIKENQGNTIECLIRDVFRSKNARKIYLVVGEEVGTGTDNEPLIKNVKIIKDLTSDFIKS